MGYREYLPHPALRLYVDRLWSDSTAACATRQVTAGAAVLRRIPPDGCVDVIIDLRYGRAEVVGPMTTAALVAVTGPQAWVAARFRPGAAHAVLGPPLDALCDQALAAEQLSLSWLCPTSLGSELEVAVRRLEQQLLTRCRDWPRPDRLTAHFVREMYGRPVQPINVMAKQAGLSRQHLSRLFRREVGLPPKHLSRIARMQRALWHLQRQPSSPLSQVAAELGYFDQAHMTLDFRALLGISPGQARRSSIFPIPSLLHGA